MTRRVHTLVAGAGIVGLMVAHELARRGAKPIVVIDAAKSLLLGASGRNGGGVRAQWTTVENIELARRSIRAFERLSLATGANSWFRQGGYLFLARSEEHLAALRKARDFQIEHGVRTRLLAPEEAREIVRDLSIEGVVGASYNPDDGTLFPWPVVHGMAELVKREGVTIDLGVRLETIRTHGASATAVTSAGDIEAEHIVLALGYQTKAIAKQLGVDLPMTAERHEILVTEALKPFLKPMVVDLSNGLYASQAMRGEVIGGMGRPHPEGESWASTFEFAASFAEAITRVIPRLSGVNILRQWAGTYDMTADARPILGRLGHHENVWVACGFSGHGFMLAPSVGEMTAELILDGRTSLPAAKFGLDRFEKGDLEPEALVIG